MPLLLQISDCHLVAQGKTLLNVDTQASLQAVLDQALSEQQPDAVVASGDIAHDAQPEVYARFLQTVRAVYPGPLLCLPGNHDVHQAMSSAALPMQPLTLAPWSIVPLDSHQDNQPEALISEMEIERVGEVLRQSAQTHVLLATHHPLVLIGAPWLDKDRIRDSEQLLDGLSQASGDRLRGVIFGHAHQEIAARCAQLPMYGAPSTCFQFAPHSQTFAVDQRSPGYRWLHLDEHGIIKTEVRRVNSFPINARIDKLKKPPPADTH
ncbi:MAG: metallophosphoesterase [Pseudomonadota bacterium]